MRIVNISKVAAVLSVENCSWESLRYYQLSKELKHAIEQKLQEEQLYFQYEFKLDRERKEMERKIIKAHAKVDANRILNASVL